MLRRLQRDARLSCRLRRGFRLGGRRPARLHQRNGQLFGRIRGDIAPAGILRDALQLRDRLLVGDVEADHMGGEGHAAAFQLARDRTRIGIAGLAPVADQDHRGGPVRMGERLGGLGDRIGHRRLAARGQRSECGIDHRALGADRRDQLDIGAVAFAPVAVGHHPQLDLGIPAIQQAGNRLARDLDLRHAVDLAPHGIGGVDDQDGLSVSFRHCRRRFGRVRVLCGGRGAERGDGEDGTQQLGRRSFQGRHGGVSCRGFSRPTLTRRQPPVRGKPGQTFKFIRQPGPKAASGQAKSPDGYLSPGRGSARSRLGARMR